MPKFTVSLTRVATTTYSVEIEADDEADAKQQAEEMAEEGSLKADDDEQIEYTTTAKEVPDEEEDGSAA